MRKGKNKTRKGKNKRNIYPMTILEESRFGKRDAKEALRLDELERENDINRGHFYGKRPAHVKSGRRKYIETREFQEMISSEKFYKRHSNTSKSSVTRPQSPLRQEQNLQALANNTNSRVDKKDVVSLDSHNAPRSISPLLLKASLRNTDKLFEKSKPCKVQCFTIQKFK